MAAPFWTKQHYPGYETKIVKTLEHLDSLRMIDLTIYKNELGLFQADVTLTLPPITITSQKSDRNDLEYQIQNDIRELVEEIVQSQIKDEF